MFVNDNTVCLRKRTMWSTLQALVIKSGTELNYI